MPKKNYPPREFLVLLGEDELNDLISACVRRLAWIEKQIDRYDLPAASGDADAEDRLSWFGDELGSLRDALFWLRHAERIEDGSSGEDPN